MPTTDDNRISHGCINVEPSFYEQALERVFAKGGVFYILPDVKPMAEVFPKFAQSRKITRHDGKGLAQSDRP